MVSFCFSFCCVADYQKKMQGKGLVIHVGSKISKEKSKAISQTKNSEAKRKNKECDYLDSNRMKATRALCCTREQHKTKANTMERVSFFVQRSG